MAPCISLRTPADGEVAIDLEKLRSVVAYKKDLFRPHLINLLLIGSDFRHELVEITPDQGLLITRALAAFRPDVVPFEQWWEQVQNPLVREADIRVL